MNIGERYQLVFMNVLSIEDGSSLQTLEYQGVPSWDSVGHMALIAALEDEFSIEMEVDDIIDFSSFSVGAEILAKYGILVSSPQVS